MIPISRYFHHRHQFVHAPNKGSSGSAAITTSKLVLTPGGPWPCVKALLRCRHWAFIEVKFENERHPQLFSTPNFLISPCWLWYIVMIVVDCCERKGLRHDKVAVSFSHECSSLEPNQLKWRSSKATGIHQRPSTSASTVINLAPSHPCVPPTSRSNRSLPGGFGFSGFRLGQEATHPQHLVTCFGQDGQSCLLWVHPCLSLNNINIHNILIPRMEIHQNVQSGRGHKSSEQHPSLPRCWHPKCPGKLHTVQQAVPGRFPT